MATKQGEPRHGTKAYGAQCRGKRYDAVEQDGHAVSGAAEANAANRREVEATNFAEHVKGIVGIGLVQRKDGLNDGCLASHVFLREPSAGANEFSRILLEQGTGDGRRRGGVANAHLARQQHVDACCAALSHELDAVEDGCDALLTCHGRSRGNVGRASRAHRPLHDVGQFGSATHAHVDGRYAAARLTGHVTRGALSLAEGLGNDARHAGVRCTHAVLHHAIICASDDEFALVKAHVGRARNSRDPNNELFEQAESADGFGEAVPSFLGGPHGGGICGLDARNNM